MAIEEGEMNIAQEIFCHDCRKYVQFNIDTELDGNHVVICPNCGHEHCRVVKNGVITGDRWDSRNNTYAVSASTITYSSTSTYATCTAANYFTYQNWSNVTVALN